jgi:short/branched chain acyl-CoA dehydrogenase
MDFDLSREQQEFQRAVRDFAADVVAPASAGHDEREEFPLEVVRAMGELGLFGIPFPERYGGLDGDFLTFCLCLEEIARVDSSVAITLEAAVGLGANPIHRFGTEEQKERWLTPLARGLEIGSLAVTEPGGGSDVRAIRTSARRDGEGWVLDGTKVFITNSGTPLTSVCIVAAKTDASAVDTFLVPTDTGGFSVGPAYRKVGWRASDTHEVVLQACRVPQGNLLGRPGRGLAQVLEVLDDGRIAMAAMAVGLARGCLEESVRYASEREAFGRPIGAFEALQFSIVDMKVAVETGRLAYLKAAWLKDRGRPYAAEAALAKLHASEAAVDCARTAVQVHGGYGYMEESPVARFYRDAKALEIGEGTSEIQRLLIARDLGLPGTELR